MDELEKYKTLHEWSQREKKDSSEEQRGALYGFLIIGSLIGLISFSLGKNSGRENSLETFTHESRLTHCDMDGAYCVVQNKEFGDIDIACDDSYKCFVNLKNKEELERQKDIEDAINEAIKEFQYEE